MLNKFFLYFNELKGWLLAVIIFIVFMVLRCTWRYQGAGIPSLVNERRQHKLPTVYGHFHEDEWAFLGLFSFRKMNVLVSFSRDGQLMKNFLTMLRFQIARGSSSRGAVRGFLSLIRQVREGPFKEVSLAVDGPKGPRHHVKKGILQLAQDLSSPIIIGAASANRAWVFEKSWSKAFIPKPFAKVTVCYDVIEQNEFMNLSPDEQLKLTENRLRSAKSMAEKLAKSPSNTE